MKLLHYRVGPVEVCPLIFIAFAGHSAHIGQTFSLDRDYLGLGDARNYADLRVRPCPLLQRCYSTIHEFASEAAAEVAELPQVGENGADGMDTGWVVRPGKDTLLRDPFGGARLWRDRPTRITYPTA